MTTYMPMPRAQDAPRFTPDPCGFDSFFEDVVELGARCQLADAAMIKWAIRYAGAEADSWHYVPCLAPARTPAPAFAEFREEVRKHYPHLVADHRYTHRDLAGLLERTRGYKEMSLEDLGKYYREFLTCSAHLVNKGTLSERDRCNSYLRGFPQPVLVEISKRLAIKRPDGYAFDDVHEAAVFVLSDVHEPFVDSPVALARGTSRDQDTIRRPLSAVSDHTHIASISARPQQPISTFPARPPLPLAPTRYPRPADTFPALGVVVQIPPRWGPPPQVNISSQECIFCSRCEHYARECPVAAQYLQQGKIARNDAGKLVLPNGRYVPRNAPGRNMRERVDNLLASQGT